MYNKLNFWLLSLSSFLFFASFNMIIPELPDFMRSIGAEDYIGLHITLFTVTAGLSRPFSGRMTDRWGRIPVMMIGAIVTGVMSFFYPLVLGATGFLILRLLHGFSTGFKPTGTAAYVADIVPPHRRGEALGVVSFFGMTGMGLGSWMGSKIANSFPIEYLFYSSSAIAVLSIIILAGMKETLEPRQKFSRDLFRVKKEDVYEPTVIRPAVVMLLNTFCFGAVISLYPDFGDYVGLDNRGTFFLYFTAASLVARVAGGRISDRYGRIIVLFVSTLLVSLGSVVVGFSESIPWFIGGGIIFGLGYGLASPTLFAWTIDLTPEGSRGRGISTLFIALEIGIGVGAALSGFVYGNDPAMFPYIFGGAAVLSFLAFLYLTTIRKTA